MKIWVDAQISPVIAEWIASTYGVDAVAVRTLRLRDARERDIFISARETNAIIMTKGRDLVDLAIQLGSPPQILWLTCGNTSNTNEDDSHEGMATCCRSSERWRNDCRNQRQIE
ncbi:MAG: DUF5615 family PIN-like protein [Nitrospira sp.]|nr:DUF5615 family PIN-like protein [Nitrospira sp.]